MAQVILLERVEKLGNLGDVVTVKPGFARNYLIPQNKALRATDDNMEYFNSQKAELEKANEQRKSVAEKDAKKFDDVKVVLVRHASEGGQLYGSVTARDVAEKITETSELKVSRGMVTLNTAFKSIGLFDVPVALHPEVIVDVKVNIARTQDEAEIQFKTGKPVISEDAQPAAVVNEDVAAEAAEEVKGDLLEEDALEAEKEQAEVDAQKAEEEAVKQAEKDAKKAEKEAAAAEAAAEAEDAEVAADDAAEEKTA